MSRAKQFYCPEHKLRLRPLYVKKPQYESINDRCVTQYCYKYDHFVGLEQAWRTNYHPDPKEDHPYWNDKNDS